MEQVLLNIYIFLLTRRRDKNKHKSALSSDWGTVQYSIVLWAVYIKWIGVSDWVITFGNFRLHLLRNCSTYHVINSIYIGVWPPNLVFSIDQYKSQTGWQWISNLEEQTELDQKQPIKPYHRRVFWMEIWLSIDGFILFLSHCFV